MKPPALIELFLRQLKQYVEQNSFVLVDREASRGFMASRGMSMGMLTDVILSLKPGDCFDGPEPDRNPQYAQSGQSQNSPPTIRERRSI